MASALLALSALISASITAIDARCTTLSQTYPDLHNCLNPTATDDESLLHDPQIAEAAATAIAAASQLIAHLQPPAQKVLEASLAFLTSAALGVVCASATAEIIREAGPQGCHINEIATKNGMDPLKIARVLRPLATQHIFREVSPDVFAHNRVSATLDTGKRSVDVLARPEDKHQGAKGYAAIMELNTDETFKAGAYIQDVVLAPSTSADELDTPLNRAFNTRGVDLFSWYERPENRVRFRRFGMAMDAGRRVASASISGGGDAAGERFDWSSLPDDTLIVDVGAGIGSISVGIARANPGLRFVVQDKAAVIREAKEFWENELPDAVVSRRVSFQEHDFFTAQPVKNADIFMLCRVCHDWSDTYALRILTHLRDAAQPSTKLIIQERIIPFVCGENAAYAHIPGAMPRTPPPSPLLANMGRMVPYLIDMQMMALLSGCERTLPHYCKLAAEAGWEIDAVYREGADPMNQMVLRPV
ncbi:O-methyltransferase [Mycena haematopus]|nr:O-methyltransferase [Mycena haematopus]